MTSPKFQHFIGAESRMHAIHLEFFLPTLWDWVTRPEAGISEHLRDTFLNPMRSQVEEQHRGVVPLPAPGQVGEVQVRRCGEVIHP